MWLSGSVVAVLLLWRAAEQQHMNQAPNLAPAASKLSATHRSPASVTIPFVNRHPYVPSRKVCLFRGLDKAAVPIGTEVWLVASDPNAEASAADDSARM